MNDERAGISGRALTPIYTWFYDRTIFLRKMLLVVSFAKCDRSVLGKQEQFSLS